MTASPLAMTITRLGETIKEKSRQQTISRANKFTSNSMHKKMVVKSQILSRGCYSFSLVEKRMMDLLISKLNGLSTDTDQFSFCEATAQEYGDTYGVNKNHSYEHLKCALDGLINKVLVIKTGNIMEKFTLLSGAKYYADEGKVSCCFNPLVVTHLHKQHHKFIHVQYKLLDVVDFKSAYTWRLYEIIISWSKKNTKKSAGWFSYSVQDLRDVLGVPPSYNFSMFDKRVLTKARAELLTTSSITTNISYKKTGKSVTFIKITFSF